MWGWGDCRRAGREKKATTNRRICQSTSRGQEQTTGGIYQSQSTRHATTSKGISHLSRPVRHVCSVRWTLVQRQRCSLSPEPLMRGLWSGGRAQGRTSCLSPVVRWLRCLLVEHMEGMHRMERLLWYLISLTATKRKAKRETNSAGRTEISRNQSINGKRKENGSQCSASQIT